MNMTVVCVCVCVCVCVLPGSLQLLLFCDLGVRCCFHWRTRAQAVQRGVQGAEGRLWRLEPSQHPGESALGEVSGATAWSTRWRPAVAWKAAFYLKCSERHQVFSICNQTEMVMLWSDPYEATKHFFHGVSKCFMPSSMRKAHISYWHINIKHTSLFSNLWFLCMFVSACLNCPALNRSLIWRLHACLLFVFVLCVCFLHFLLHVVLILTPWL